MNKIVDRLLFIALPLIIIAPIVTMWCIDVIFGTNIPLTLKTWFAMLLLIGIFGGVIQALRLDI